MRLALEPGVGWGLGLLGDEQPGGADVDVRRHGHWRRRQQSCRCRSGRRAGQIAGAAPIAILQAARVLMWPGVRVVLGMVVITVRLHRGRRRSVRAERHRHGCDGLQGQPQQ